MEIATYVPATHEEYDQHTLKCTPSASGGLHHDHYEPIALGTHKRENIGDELYAPHRRALVCREYECD